MAYKMAGMTAAKARVKRVFYLSRFSPLHVAETEPLFRADFHKFLRSP